MLAIPLRKTNLRRSLKTRDKNKASISHGIIIGKLWKTEIDQFERCWWRKSHVTELYMNAR